MEEGFLAADIEFGGSKIKFTNALFDPKKADLEIIYVLQRPRPKYDPNNPYKRSLWIVVGGKWECVARYE